MEKYRPNTSNKSIAAKQKAFLTTAKKAGEAAHDFLVEVICHAAPTEAGGNGHGDVTALDGILEKVHQSARTASIKQWLYAYTPIRFDEEGNASVKANGMKKPELWELEKADKNPYFSNKEQVVKPFTLRDLEKLLKQQVDKLKESALAYSQGKTEVFEEGFKPAAAMRELAAKQKALGYTVTANPAEIVNLVGDTEPEQTEELEPA